MHVATLQRRVRVEGRGHLLHLEVVGGLLWRPIPRVRGPDVRDHGGSLVLLIGLLVVGAGAVVKSTDDWGRCIGGVVPQEERLLAPLQG